jgi:hypothetical protein
MDLMELDRIFHPTAAEYIFSTACGNFSRIDHILGHKSSLNKNKKTEITFCILSDNNGRKL